METQGMNKVFGITGRSGSGKTTLLEKLIPCLKARGLVVSVIKHAHHDVDIDKPGKDSYRHRVAGAAEVLLVSRSRYALMREIRDGGEPSLAELLCRLAPCDLALVEGFKEDAMPKLEVFRVDAGLPPLYPERGDILAVACDTPLDISLPCLPLDNTATIADFILARLEISPPC
jgi:molybdopterin-guanine dinucleotide biosynthesis protein B